MKKLIDLARSHREALSYLFFGALTTLVNIAAYNLLDRAGLPTLPATGLATAISILFAYFTNRRWVFESRAVGRAAWREFGAFVACRLSTLLLDMAFMGVTVDFLGARWIGADAGKSWTLWKNAMKLASNVVVVVVNYVLSKRVIFRKK